MGVGRDLEQWKNVPPRATPILQQEAGRASITYQGVEHSVLKAAEIQKFLRRVASGVICILASTFPWKAEGYGQGGGARLPETDRVIWQTVKTRQWPAELERTGTGHGSSLHKSWGLTQCLERPGEGPRGPCQGRCKRDNLGESCQSLCWFLQAALPGLGRFYTHSLISASQQPQGLGPSSF